MVQYVPKTAEELERNFLESYQRLVRAGQSYDQGHREEASNIAQLAFNFVYDNGSVGSILSHLNLKNIAFVSTAREAPVLSPSATLLSPEYRVITASIGFDGMDYRAVLDKAGQIKMQPFHEWYAEVVLAWHGRESIKRGELIEFIRHTEAGHVAAGYQQRWSQKMMGLMRGDWVDGYMELNSSPPQGPDPHAPAYATIRQIGWELEETLRRGCSTLTDRANFKPTPGPRMKPLTQTP